MSIYEYDEEGFEEGIVKEQENGIRILIESCGEFGVDKNNILQKQALD